MHDQLSRLPLKLGQSFPDRLEERLLAVAANVFDVVSLDRVKSHAAEISQERVLGLDLQAGGVVESHPEVVAAEAVGPSQVLVSLDGPVASLQRLANLSKQFDTFLLCCFDYETNLII